MQIALCNRIVRLHCMNASRSAQFSMRLRCADNRRNVTKEEGSIVQNGLVANQLCALLYEREGTLYRKPTFSYVNSRNYSVESPRGIRVDLEHVAMPIVEEPDFPTELQIKSREALPKFIIEFRPMRAQYLEVGLLTATGFANGGPPNLRFLNVNPL